MDGTLYKLMFEHFKGEDKSWQMPIALLKCNSNLNWTKIRLAFMYIRTQAYQT